ncbi:hypothetical protein QM012_003982 [Aureobasidium pullulans]|uniref:Transaldolase n=1 Tax=Aureobasidium pullulans TaxID=5580 RepID=A0ABR0T8N8_AURPU
MALLSRQRSLDGRTSRASTTSVHSKARGLQASQGSGDILDAAAPGVLSMLKTSTDVGDVGEFSHNTGRLPAALRPTHQRRNNPSRLSNSSNHSAYTYNTNHSRIPSHGSRKAPNVHNPQARDTVSAMSGGTGNGVSGRHGSMVSLQTLATMPPHDNRLPPMSRGPPSTSPYGPLYAQDGRSYSLTHSHQGPSLRPAKSVTSLRSQGGAQFQPPRPSFAHPLRHKRPGFRTPSPALSDYTGSTYQASHNQAHTFETDPRYPTEQSSAYHGSNDPAYYSQLAPSESYQGSAPGRSYGPASGRGMHRPNMPIHNNDYPYGIATGSRYIHHQQPTLPLSTQHNFQELNYYGQHGPPIQALPSLGYVSTSRVGTPGLDAMPSSSRQGSSSPPSIDPPTPRDTTTVQAMIDPNLLQPTLSELPEDHSEYKSVQSYLRYTEQSTMYELDASQPAAVELEADTPTAKRTGLVQRIRNLLEDRAASQEHLPSTQSQPQQDVSKLVVPQPFQSLRQGPVELCASKRSSVHEPIELDVPPRITRQLIQANTAPSSSEHNTTTSLAPEETVKGNSDQKTIEEHPEVPRDEDHGGRKTGRQPFLNYSDNQTSDSSTRPNGAGVGAQITLSTPLSTSNHTNQLVAKDENKTKRLSEEVESGCVSPQRPDERVVRDSIVSPMATQTLHITSIQEQSQISDQNLETAKEPAHDRSSKQISDITEVTSSLSMPTGPFQTFQASPSSDHVTDVAIKFSIPRSSDHGRAQLVNLSNLSDTPVRTSVEIKKARSTEDNSLQCSSLSSIEKVAPLRIRRMESFLPVTTGTEGTDLSSFVRRSFPRKRSMWTTAQSGSNRSSCDSTTDLGMVMFKTRPGYLPDLNEDSKEDISTRNTKSSYAGLRLSDTPSLRLKSSRDTVRRSDEATQQSYLPPRPPRMSLSELREIPSLNFSRMDLFDKLNEELETHLSRSSKSLAGVRGERRSGTRRSPLPHLASIDHIRERYTSFFTTPESSEPLEDSTAEALDLKSTSRTLPEKNHNDADIAPTKSFAHSIRPISTQQMLGMASEISRLPIPSVAALSERLSTLLPTIKHLHIDCAPVDQTAMNDAIDRIHHLGRPEGEAAELLRSSTGLHQLAAIADNIATNGTHDSAFLEVQKSGRLMKELPPLPEDSEKFSLSDSGLDRNTTLITEGATSTSELEVPKPALLRGKSLSIINSKDEDLHPEFASRHSLVHSTQNMRPWNFEESYPWTGNSPGIKIDFPAPVLRRHSSPPKLVNRQSRNSIKTKSETEETLEPNSTLPSSPIASNSETVTPTVLTIHDRKSSKKSLIGSLSRRIGLSTRVQSGTTAREGALAGRASPGDRYPSTSLQSPHTMTMEDVRSFFSDSTEEEHDAEHRGSFRKQITSFRGKSTKAPNGHVSVPYSQSLDAHRGRSLDQYHRPSNVRTTSSLFGDRFTEPVTPQNYDGMVGMGRVEFRVKRVAERLRHIWMKGGEMIRSLSHRSRQAKRQHRERDVEFDNWLADSLYSRD